jgi:hypothetical protein
MSASNPETIYKNLYRANLPAGVTFNSTNANYYYNGQRFNDITSVEFYRNYLFATMGFTASPLALFAAGEQGVWYDPSDLSTLFQDSAGTTPVTAAGQPVGRMLDKSGRGNHATQAISAQRPTYQIDAAGKPHLSFDGIDDGMVTGNINFSATDAVTVWVGLRKLSDAARSFVFHHESAGTRRFSLEAPNASLGNYAAGSGGTLLTVATNSAPAPNTSVLSFSAKISTDTLVLRRNGVQVASSTSNQGIGNYANSILYIGRFAGTLFPFSGNLYSLIIRGAETSSNQIVSTETYVNTETGAY